MRFTQQNLAERKKLEKKQNTRIFLIDQHQPYKQNLAKNRVTKNPDRVNCKIY